jgi:hypothetical protein
MRCYPFTFVTMVLSTSKKLTKQTNARSPLQTISHSKKKSALKKTKPQALASLQLIASTSRCASVKDVEDVEPMHIGGTLDADGDQIMEPTEDKEDEPNSSAKDPISLSDEEDVWADEEEIQRCT